MVLVLHAVPHVVYCAMVVDDCTQRLSHKRNQRFRVNILLGLDAQVQPVLRIFQPFQGLIQCRGGGTFGGVRVSFCMVAKNVCWFEAGSLIRWAL